MRKRSFCLLLVTSISIMGIISHIFFNQGKQSDTQINVKEEKENSFLFEIETSEDSNGLSDNHKEQLLQLDIAGRTEDETRSSKSEEQQDTQISVKEEKEDLFLVEVEESSEDSNDLSDNNKEQLLQLDITEITDDETECLKYIIAENREEIEEYLRSDSRENKVIRFGSFDFTGDGIEEIIYEKGFVDYVPFTYTYILGRNGIKLSEFAWTNLDQTDIYISEENVYYLSYYSLVAAHNRLSLYGEIRYDGKGLEQKLLFMEWDVRYDIDIERNVKEGYSVHDDFKKEEADKLWNGREGITELSETKEDVADKNVLEEYKEKWSNIEPVRVTWLGAIIYIEEDDEFIWQTVEY